MTREQFHKRLTEQRCMSSVASALVEKTGMCYRTAERWINGQQKPKPEIKAFMNEIAVTLFGEGIQW